MDSTAGVRTRRLSQSQSRHRCGRTRPGLHWIAVPVPDRLVADRRCARRCRVRCPTAGLARRACRPRVSGGTPQHEGPVKAILHTQYGAPDLLQLKEVDKPAPKDNEVLIAIHATTVSTGDCNVRNFTFVTKSMLPIAKLMFGIRKPSKACVLGTELAGEVEKTGKDVNRADGLRPPARRSHTGVA